MTGPTRNATAIAALIIALAAVYLTSTGSTDTAPITGLALVLAVLSLGDR